MSKTAKIIETANIKYERESGDISFRTFLKMSNSSRLRMDLKYLEKTIKKGKYNKKDYIDKLLAIIIDRIEDEKDLLTQRIVWEENTSNSYIYSPFIIKVLKTVRKELRFYLGYVIHIQQKIPLKYLSIEDYD